MTDDFMAYHRSRAEFERDEKQVSEDSIQEDLSQEEIDASWSFDHSPSTLLAPEDGLSLSEIQMGEYRGQRFNDAEEIPWD